MAGFERELRSRLLAFSPEILIERQAATSSNAKVESTITGTPDVVAVAPFLSSQVMIVAYNSEGRPAYVSGGVLHALEPKRNLVLTELPRILVGGNLATLSSSHPVTVTEQGVKRVVELPGAIVGESLASQLGLRIGDPFVVVSPATMLQGMGTPRLRRFVVGAMFYSGMYQYDSTLVLVARRQAQALLNGDPAARTGYQVRVERLFDAPRIGEQIAQHLGPGFKVSDWTEANAPLFSALRLEKLTYFIVLLLFVLVAAFNIIATLVMVAMERRRELAIMRAMGARAASVASIFLWEGAILGIAGTAIGSSLGIAVAYLVGRYRLIHLPPDVFMVSWVPAQLSAANFGAVAAAAVVLCLAAAVYPALRARALSPVEIIRYE